MQTKPKINILLVDDRPENLISLKAVLDSPDYKLVKADSGSMALECLSKDDFALILLDVQMPVMDGFETATFIKQNEKYRTIPIIFITANNRDELFIFKGYDVGAVDYVLKPFEPSILRSKVAIFAELHQKKLEIEQQNEILQKTIKAITLRDELISVASHELNSPLTPLKLHFDTLRLRCNKGEFGETLGKLLLEVLNNSDQHIHRLQKMIERLLDVSRVQNGMLTPELEKTDLANLVRNVLEHYSRELAKAKCSVEIDSPNSLIGYWDKLSIEQAFINLLSNAMKYASGKPIRVTLSSNDGRAELYIQDQGIGIAKENFSRIFLPFARVGSRKRTEGMGLGLYITASILEAHGGSIEVDSEPGRGSTFRVSLPLHPPNETIPKHLTS